MSNVIPSRFALAAFFFGLSVACSSSDGPTADGPGEPASETGGSESLGNTGGASSGGTSVGGGAPTGGLDGGGGVPGGGGAVDSASGGADVGGSGGDSATGGALSVDCSGISSAGFQLCTSDDGTCSAIYEGGEGCEVVCGAAGLTCVAAYENVDAACAADDALPATTCDSGHQSDFCVCGGPQVPPVGTGGSDGAGGAVGTGGMDATGGAPPVINPSAGVDGWASVASQGLTTTTGGGELAPVDVTTCDALATAVSGDTPRVIRIPAGTVLDCGVPGTTSACELQCSAAAASPVFWRIPVGDQTCTTLADFNGDGTLEVPAGQLVSKNTKDRGISIGSNKTIFGGGTGASIFGVSFSIQDVSNVIVRNLTIGEINPDLIEAGDGLTINTSHHVWIDHCEFSMISDGYFDIRYDSSHVTLSYNHIVGQNEFICSGQHNFISLVDAAPGVTFHHNYFDHPGGRNPKVGGTSLAHLYNNYYEGVSYFCANSGTGSQVLVENNHYEDSSRPHWKDGGLIEATGNVYTGSTSATYRDGGDSVFTPPYDYTLDAAGSLNTSVPASAGPRASLGF